MKRLACILILVSVLLVTSGCSQAYSAGDAVPPKINARILDLEHKNAVMTELVPPMVIAVTILKYEVENKGSVGGLCGKIGLVRPNVEAQLEARRAGQGDPAVIGAIQHMLSEFSGIQKELRCEHLASG